MTYYDPTLGQGAAPSASAPHAPCQKQSVSPDGHVSSAVNPDAPELPFGTWFNEAYDLREPEGAAFTSAILERIAPHERRVRKRRSIDAANHYTITRAVLANAMRCHFYRAPPLVAYTTGAGQAYYKSAPMWLNAEAMRRTIGLLEVAGMVTTATGEWGVASSTYAATPALLELAMQHGITPDSLTVHRLRPERLVRLYRQKSGNSRLVDFVPTEETEYWADLLAAHNAFTASHQIELELSAEEERQWLSRWNRKRLGDGSNRPRPKVIRPELLQTDLYRSFNNGGTESFMEGGRLYGAWWIGTPKEQRRKITIDGLPLVEADYSCCQPRMLYHLRGIDYVDDCYELEPLIYHARASGLPDEHYREAVKAMMQALINGNSRDKLELAPLKDGHSYDPFEPLAVRRMLEAKHEAISDDLGTGIGLHLQRKDSDLALTIITSLMWKGIAALPIHDAFMVQQRYEAELVSEMENAYRLMFNGYNPIIKVSGSSEHIN
ncbi:hypothetical protein ACFOON_13495 [Novosphingobium piscinae]|uniref:Uncharacterized protein n=1 Tax=Novosphingobium piscinae TaxID=1507448 RepID=A0A7X1FZM6_9SPHN|nr:hypothetical protein [Novosphingobium piscinae]MBC2669789.1 hypothetical protein [Novosphingobium piscinae]